LTVSFCPPDMTKIDEQSLRRCLTYNTTAEAATARRLPAVEAAGAAAFFGLTVSSPTAPERTLPVSAILMFDADTPPMEGLPVVLAGRRPDPTATDEIAVNETLAGLLDVAVGDELDLTFASLAELGATAEPGESFSGPRQRARVVGLERSFVDLLGVVSTGSSAIDAARVSAGPALAASIAEAASFSGMAVAARDGDVAAAQAAIDEAFAGRLYQVTPLVDADERDPIVDAIRYEAGGTMVFGAITALADAAFAGQAVSRQSRREWADGPTLRAIGMSDRDAGLAALLRGAVTGSIAAALAIAAAIGLSAFGPFGVAGQAEIDPGIVIDGPVLAVGAVVVVIVVTAATWWPVAQQFRRSTHRPSTTRRTGLGAVQSHLPAPAMAGVSMSVSGGGAGGLPTGTALGGVALAVATALTAIGLTASLDALAGSPEQFGAPWDLSASAAIGNPDELPAVAEVIGASPDVEAAAAIVGTDAAIGDQVTWFQAFQPIEGVDALIGPVITAGRAPTSVDEIALGVTTMADQGVSIGDTVQLRSVNTVGTMTELTVVGTVIINDSFENNPGRGGVVTVEWIEESGQELTPDPFVVRLRPGADVERMRADLGAVASGGVYGPQLQSAIRNVDRVSWVPFLLAALVGALAIASLAHALVLSVRRQRGQLAILKSLGFRRGQVRAAVAWHATALVVVAVVVGVPLGVILGRWGWRIVADEVGVASPPVTPLLWLAVIAVGVVVVANLVAAYPAWRAAREPTARALRVE
ncbi:MAG: FtsX-like permease family protein, partial [Ilumatobacteraceae bacterium]